jgi:hypothetical protein
MSASVCLLKDCTPYHMSSNICGRNYEVYGALSSRKSHGYLSLQKKRRQRICLFLSVCSNEDEAYRCPEIFLIEPIQTQISELLFSLEHMSLLLQKDAINNKCPVFCLAEPFNVRPPKLFFSLKIPSSISLQNRDGYHHVCFCLCLRKIFSSSFCPKTDS